jgi:hypothetical protein
MKQNIEVGETFLTASARRLKSTDNTAITDCPAILSYYTGLDPSCLHKFNIMVLVQKAPLKVQSEMRISALIIKGVKSVFLCLERPRKIMTKIEFSCRIIKYQ